MRVLSNPGFALGLGVVAIWLPITRLCYLLGDPLLLAIAEGALVTGGIAMLLLVAIRQTLRPRS